MKAVKLTIKRNINGTSVLKLLNVNQKTNDIELFRVGSPIFLYEFLSSVVKGMDKKRSTLITPTYKSGRYTKTNASIDFEKLTTNN